MIGMARSTSKLFLLLLSLFGIALLSFASQTTLAFATPLTTSLATLPTGFSESQIINQIESPTVMTVAPDGRVFIGLQGGKVIVVKNGQVLALPFVMLDTDSFDEQGVIGLTLDPNFTSNGYLYLTYTAKQPNLHQRIVRFTANGDVAAGGESLIFELPQNRLAYHLAGALLFGKDGKLYVMVGEGVENDQVQSDSSFSGKILRINKDGTIPTDGQNYCNDAGNIRCAIWAKGFRNPFTAAVQPGSGRLYINDVGGSSWEEVNEGGAKRNFGWPNSEGATSNTGETSPIYAYDHGQGCAITGGVFYNPTTALFPGQYVGKYFFLDYCQSWMRTLDPANPATATNFGTLTGIGIVSLQLAPDGSLYYLARGTTDLSGGSGDQFKTGSLFKLSYTGGSAPTIAVQPANRTVSVGQQASFAVSANGTAPLSYQWRKNGNPINGATALSYTTPAATLADNGATFDVVVTNSAGSATSNAATLTVTTNQPPTATITSPATGTLYRGGVSYAFTGSGSDPEQGTLPASAFTWKVDLHHDAHTHPAVPAISGSSSFSFTVPPTGHTETNVWYRVYLTVKDGNGLAGTTYIELFPKKARITLATNPSGLQVTLDGQPRSAPSNEESVTGVQRTIGVASPQTLNGVTYRFTSWSDSGAQSHSIAGPENNTTYTANFVVMQQPTSTRTPTQTSTPGATPTPTRTATPVTGTGVTIAGTVRDDNGAPLFNIRVTAYRPQANQWVFVTNASTDSTGAYRIPNLTPGTYRVRFYENNGRYITEYYNNVRKLAQATDIVLGAGITASGIDGSLTKITAVSVLSRSLDLSSTGSVISGTIHDLTNGQPLSNVQVVLYQVPFWRASSGPNDIGAGICQSSLSKADDVAWVETPPQELGEWAANDGQPDVLNPALNPQASAGDGSFGWAVSEGCWFVEVFAEGYSVTISPMVGVTSGVTSLDVALSPLSNRTFLPLVER